MSDIFRVYNKLARLATSEFNDIVAETRIITLPSGEPAKLRLAIIDDSFLDVCGYQILAVTRIIGSVG